MGDDFDKALMDAFKGAMHRASDPFWHTDFLPTGVPNIDLALGGGFGYGRLAEIFGEWSSGKTMIMYYALANNQRMKGKKGKPGKSILFESEGAFTPDFFRALGGDPEQLLVYPVDTVEDVFDGMASVCDLMEKLVKSGEDVPVAIGWDSIAATGTKHLMETGMEKRDMSKAYYMTQGTQLITTLVKRCRVCIIAANQVREKIGDNSSEPNTPGGKAWPFHASQRVEVSFDGGYKGSVIVDSSKEEVELGRWIKGMVVKNKLASPFGKFSIPIYVKVGAPHPQFVGTLTKLGIDVDEALFWLLFRKLYTMASGAAIVEGSAGWYTLHPEVDKRQGDERRKFRQAEWPKILEANPQLRTLAYALKKPGSTTPPAPSSGDARSGGVVVGAPASGA